MLPGIRSEPYLAPLRLETPVPPPPPAQPTSSFTPLQEALAAPLAEQAPVTERLHDRDRLVLTLNNDNWLSMVGMEPGSGFGAGDDFGATHSYKVELRLPRESLDYLFGHSSAVYTREVGERTTNAGGKVIAQQTPVEISKLYFGIEVAAANHHTRGQLSIGLRNAEREIPGLAMSAQQLLHSFLPRAPGFDNRPSEGMAFFAEFEAARGIEVGPVKAEAGATLNTYLAGSRLFAIVEAELPVAGGLRIQASQLAQVLANQNFSFVSSAGASYEFPGILIGVEAKIPLGDISDDFTLYNDRDPLLELRLEVGL
jgi:hypothetical protein